MPNTLAPYLKQQFFSNAGLPLAYGYVYTYAAGTSTPQATYNASGGLNPNPVPLDFRGSCDLWGPANQGYKINVTDSLGNQIPGYPIDGVVFGPATYGSFTATAAGFLGTAPTALVNWVMVGPLVTAIIQGFSGTSNSTQMSITGIPTALQPPTIQQSIPIAGAEDNGSAVFTGVFITIVPGSSSWTLANNGGYSGWTATGTKGIAATNSTINVPYLLL